MKKSIEITVVCVLVVIAIAAVGLNAPQTKIISYVLSDSMAPAMNVGDVFFIIPRIFSGDPSIGDIILFQHPSGSSKFIVHRVVGYAENGFITKGDNSPFTDQQGGLSPIKTENILGKVVTLSGIPLVIPLVGIGINYASKIIAANALWILLLIGSLIALAFTGDKYKVNRKKMKRQGIKIKYLYFALLFMMLAGTTYLTMFSVNNINIRYLSSTYVSKQSSENIVVPGSTLDYSFNVENNGLLPNYILLKPSSLNVEMEQSDLVIWPGETKTIPLKIVTQQEIGWHEEQVEITSFRLTIPLEIMRPLISYSPYLTAVTADIMIALIFALLYSTFDDRNERLSLKKYQLLNIKKRLRGY